MHIEDLFKINRHNSLINTMEKYPAAVNRLMVGEYAAISKSGGGFFYDEVLEYRVWVHPTNGDDVFYNAFEEYEKANEFALKTEGAEDVLVLVLQKEYIDEPEPGQFIIVSEERITEWQPQWLIDSKREADSIDNFLREHLSG